MSQVIFSNVYILYFLTPELCSGRRTLTAPSIREYNISYKSVYIKLTKMFQHKWFYIKTYPKVSRPLSILKHSDLVQDPYTTSSSTGTPSCLGM